MLNCARSMDLWLYFINVVSVWDWRKITEITSNLVFVYCLFEANTERKKQSSSQNCPDNFDSWTVFIANSCFSLFLPTLSFRFQDPVMPCSKQKTLTLPDKSLISEANLCRGGAPTPRVNCLKTGGSPMPRRCICQGATANENAAHSDTNQSSCCC